MTFRILTLGAVLAATTLLSSPARAEEGITATSPLFQPEAVESASAEAPPEAAQAEESPETAQVESVVQPEGDLSPPGEETSAPIPSPSSTPQPEPGSSWRVAGIPLTWVPGGCYLMGSAPGQAGRDSDEGPQHKVCVSGFWMGIHEITQSQWQKMMGTTPSFFNKGGSFPVESVTFHQVETFLKKMSQSWQMLFRLPTEAEWEYACRSGGQRQMYGGPIVMLDDGEELPGWYSEDSGWYPHQVGMKEPNELGIYDMSGNVGEWVADVYGNDAYAQHELMDPVLTGPADAPRVRRGGSWAGDAREMRCANRYHARPGMAYYGLGFRVVVEP